MRVFPTYAFSFSEVSPDIERRVISGGTAINGAEDVIAADGGGRFFVEFGDPYLDQPSVAQAWRALSATLQDGVAAIIVPICDLRHQFNENVTVPTTLPFWEETDLATDTGVTLAADAALRATTLELTIDDLPGPLVAGMWFSIDHGLLRHRAYLIAEVTEQDASSATITINPPLREATDEDTAVEFTDPRCVCRLDGPMRSPTSYGFANAPPIRFVEYFSNGSDGAYDTVGALRYWRLLFPSGGNDGTNNRVGLGEVELRGVASGPDLTTTDPANTFSLESSYFSTSFRSRQAFNGIATGFEGWLSANDSDTNAWIRWRFDTAVEINEVRLSAIGITGGAAGGIYGPREITVQSSDDGVTWTTEWVVAGGPYTWTDGQARTFTRP